MFIQMLTLAGFNSYYKKEKIGYSLKTVEGIVFDISNVNDIGKFLEIEKLVEEDKIEETIKELKEIMISLGLSEDQIETKSYAKLILESSGL